MIVGLCLLCKLTLVVPLSERKLKSPSFISKTLPAIADFMSMVWFKAGRILPYVGIALAAVSVAAVVYLAITYPGTFLEVIGFRLLSIVAGAAILAMLVGIVALIVSVLERFDVGRAIKAGARSVHNHTCANIKLKE